jgi:PAS domain S-box-containing protein
MPAATLAFGRLFDAQPFVCLALDRQGRVLAVTDVLLRLTGATRGAVVGQPLTPTGLGPFGAAWREALPEALLPGAQASTLQPIFFPSPSESAPAALLPWWVPQLTPVPAESGPGVEYVLCSAQQTLAPAASSPLVSPLAPRLAELQFILDQVPAHLAALLEPSHVPAYVSPGMRLLLDDRPMLGKPLADTMPELVDPGLLHLFDEVYRTGEALVLTDFPVSGIDVPTLRGSRRYFDLTYQPLRGADQQVMGVLLFALETTGRVRSRQRLAHLTEEVQRREAQFQELTEALPHITSSADGAGRNTYTSPQWFAYTGQDPAAESRPPWDEAIHPDDLPLVVAQYGAAVSAGQPWELEFRLRRHDGHYRWHHTRTRPSFDAKGRLDGWHGTTVDIHDRRLAEDALRSSQAQLAHKDQELRPDSEPAAAGGVQAHRSAAPVQLYERSLRPAGQPPRAAGSDGCRSPARSRRPGPGSAARPGVCHGPALRRHRAGAVVAEPRYPGLRAPLLRLHLSGPTPPRPAAAGHPGDGPGRNRKSPPEEQLTINN